MRNRKNKDMVLAAIFMAIILLLAFTPGLGYILVGVIQVTTIHIPVILGGILLGWKYGTFLGGVFGLTSFINNTIVPKATSFVFTPFYSLGEVRGNLWSIVICFVPRILIGIVSYFVFQLIIRKNKKQKLKRTTAFITAGIVGSMTNTILVMNMIYLFFGKQYANVTGKEYNLLYKAIMVVIGTNGVCEAILAAVIVSVAGTVLYRIKQHN